MNYQFEINSDNKIGNAKIGEKIPFLATFTSGGNLSREKLMTIQGQMVTAPQVDCVTTAPNDWSDCMNCLIIEKCGSNWVCAVVCGTDIVLCVGAAAISCMVVK